MIGDIRKHLESTRFLPFNINMGDGRVIHVPSRDHIALTPFRAIDTHANKLVGRVTRLADDGLDH